MAKVLLLLAVLLAAAALVAEAKVKEAPPPSVKTPVPAPAPAVRRPVPAPAATVRTPVPAPAPTVRTPVPAPAPGPDCRNKSATFPFKLILRNVAERAVTFKLESLGRFAPAKQVVTQKQQWAAIGPFNVSFKHSVVHVIVTVKKNYKAIALRKTLPLNLLKRFGGTTAQGVQYLVLTASESWSWRTGKSLLIKIGNEIVLTFKL